MCSPQSQYFNLCDNFIKNYNNHEPSHKFVYIKEKKKSKPLQLQQEKQQQ